MAGHGAPPKLHRTDKRLDRLRQAEMITVLATGTLAGEPLPTGILPDGEQWHPMTAAFWDALRRHPVLADEPAVGWRYLIDTAALHHQMWAHGELRFAPEIRRRCEGLGATPVDRLRMRVRIEPAPPSEPPEPGGIAARRRRLSDPDAG